MRNKEGVRDGGRRRKNQGRGKEKEEWRGGKRWMRRRGREAPTVRRSREQGRESQRVKERMGERYGKKEGGGRGLLMLARSPAVCWAEAGADV